MGQTVKQHGVKTGIARDDLPRVAGGRVALEDDRKFLP
jgi:hypothetical protein